MNQTRTSQMERVEQYEMAHFRFEETKKFIEKYYPSYISLWDEYDNFIAKNLESGMTFLDAGCGWKNDRAEKYLKNVFSIGVDLDLEALKDNVSYENLCHATLEKLPFKEGTIDIITSKSVIEHLEHPEFVFDEFFRILKKGGILILILPNRYNIVMFFGRFIPLFLSKKFLKLFSKKVENDVYPTYFKCCTINSLDFNLRKVGFLKKDLILKGDFILFMYSKSSILLWIIFDNITNSIPILKMNILAMYVKN